MTLKDGRRIPHYITNTCEAEDQLLSGTLTDYQICDPGGSCRPVSLGSRVNEEAAALYSGLVTYFDSGSGDGGGEKCPPGKQKQGKCTPYRPSRSISATFSRRRR